MNFLVRFVQDALRGSTREQRPAVDRRLGIVFQPWARGQDGRIAGFEALVRTSSQEAPGRADKVFQALIGALHSGAQEPARERYDWQGQRLERATFELSQGATPWSETVATLHVLCQAQGLRCLNTTATAGDAPMATPCLPGALVFGR